MARILVVDDEPDLRFILRRLFESAGHEVVDAGHGAAALEVVNGVPPDLVVTDMTMPIMDGAELIEHLRSEPTTAGIPILAVTGDHLRASGADAILPKPFQWKELIALAEGLLDNRKASSS